MTDLIKRDDALAAIDMALNNATGDLFDCHAAIRALPAVASATLTPNPVDDSKTANPVVNDSAAIPALQARIKELIEERNDLRNFDDYFRSVCGFKRDGRDSSKCLDDFLAGINRQDTSIPFDHFLQVVKERDDLGRKLNTARYGQPDFAWSIHEKEMADLRAKLAKAVEELDEYKAAAAIWQEDFIQENQRLYEAKIKLAMAMEALQNLHHAVCGETGFASAVRNHSGKAYPWEALDIADAQTRNVLAELEGE